MFSKNKKLIALILTLTFVTACSLKIGEKPAVDKEIRIAGPGCLGRVGEVIQKYVNSQTSEAEVNGFFDCMQKAIKTFSTFARGNHSEDSYTPEELRQYFTHIIRDRTVREQFIKELMKVKKAFIGGPKDKLSRYDLDKTIETLERIRRVALNLRPHLKVYNSRFAQKGEFFSMQEIELAVSTFEAASRDFGLIFQDAKESYPLDSLEPLIQEFRYFSAWEDLFVKSKSAASWSNLIRKFKVMSVGGTENKIEPSEWTYLFHQVGGWYQVVVRQQHLRNSKNLFFGDGRENLSKIIDHSFQLLQKSLDVQKERTLSFEQMDLFIDALKEVDLTPFQLSAKSLKSALRVFITKTLGDVQLQPKQRFAKGLTRYHLSQALLEFERWSQIQSYLDETFQPALVNDVRFGDKGSPTFKFSRNSIFEINEIFKLNGSNETHINDIRTMANNYRPLFGTDLTRIVLTEESKLKDLGVVHGFNNLSMMNLVRATTSLIFRGYSWNVNRLPNFISGVSEDDLQLVYEDFKELGTELHLFDPRQSTAGRRAFLEGNLFTYESNGLNAVSATNPLGHLLSFGEMVQLFSFLYSGGQLGESMYALSTEQCSTQGVDIIGKAKIEKLCLKRLFTNSLTSLIGNMPGLTAYLNKAKPVVKEEFAQILLDTGTNATSEKNWVEKSELNTLATVLHYSEAVFTRFNTNDSSYLEQNEVDKAFLVFGGLISKLTKKMCHNFDDDRIREIYYYILQNAEAPKSSFGDWASMYWRSNIVGWDVQIDRLQLLKVFKALIQMTTGVSSKSGDNCNKKKWWEFSNSEDKGASPQPLQIPESYRLKNN